MGCFLNFFCLILASLFFFFSALSAASNAQDLLKSVLEEGISVNLREPTFCDGILSTESGGVIEGPDIRIQAKCIKYLRKTENEVPVCSIVAEGDLLLELGNYLFVGERLEYDFQTHTGYLYCGRSGMSPWYAGGTVIRLCADGSYEIEDGFVTTSDGPLRDWEIRANMVRLQDERFLTAEIIKFRFLDRTFLSLSSLKYDLQSLYESPLHYFVGWGGRQGPRFGVAYEVFSWNGWKTFIRGDYRLTRGPGIGIEAYYDSDDHTAYFQSINYVARDSSIFIPSQRFRYRFQGVYHQQFDYDKTTVDLIYDKLSDRYMATDYADQGLEIEEADRTQLDIRRQEELWISHLLVSPRLNNFETEKQELPTLLTTWKPFVLGSSGIVSNSEIKLSYLDFVYSHNLPNVHDYNSTRFALSQRFYRPSLFGPLIATPESGGELIFYGNSPGGSSRFLLTGFFGCNLQAPMYNMYSFGKHVIIPYAQYEYLTFPTVSPNNHYIFDIEDGWYYLNMVRFGIRQNLYSQDCRGEICRLLEADLYANAFINVKTIPRSIQKVYGRTTYHSCSRLKHVLEMAWDFDVDKVDHINFRNLWTVNDDLALAIEYRHRDAFDWRKLDRENFILDAFRTIQELRHSQLSDRRDTALLHIFYRIHPRLAVEFESRHGWNRKNHSRYTEFEIDLLTKLRSAFQVKLSYQHKESEDRVAVYFSIAIERPDRLRTSDLVPCLEF